LLIEPPNQVSRKQGAGGAFALEEEIDRELPFARTCTHTVSEREIGTNRFENTGG